MSVDPGAEVCCFEERGLSVACRVVFGASLTHPCFAGALEVRFDFALVFEVAVELFFRGDLKNNCSSPMISTIVVNDVPPGFFGLSYLTQTRRKNMTGAISFGCVRLS